MDNKITIIEGPTPTFEPVTADWADSVLEGSDGYEVMVTNLRTMNGRGLVERCYATWNCQDTMYLHFKNSYGLEQQAPIVAARRIETPEGEKLALWVRVKNEDIKQAVQPDDDETF